MKFNEDTCFSNTYNAMVSGVDKDELMTLELSFLKLINFKLRVTPETFQSYYQHLSETSERRALLSNCSCLNPSHSYKVSHEMYKKSHKNLSNQREMNLSGEVEPPVWSCKWSHERPDQPVDQFSYEHIFKSGHSKEKPKVVNQGLDVTCAQVGSENPVTFSNEVRTKTSSPPSYQNYNFGRSGHDHKYDVNRCVEKTKKQKITHNFQSCKYENYGEGYLRTAHTHRVSF